MERCKEKGLKLNPNKIQLKKGNEFKCEEHVHGRALNEIRQILSEPPVLRFFDPNVVPVLQCDASMNGLGACLLQNNQPVAYASRSLIQYAQIEKEMLQLCLGWKDSKVICMVAR